MKRPVRAPSAHFGVRELCCTLLVALCFFGCASGSFEPNSGFLSAPFSSATADAQNSGSLEEKIFRLVNFQRASAQIAPLYLSRQLADIAREHSRKMAISGTFDHHTRGEAALLERVSAAGIQVDRVAENLFAADQMRLEELAETCVTMWMGSDGHRRNILSAELDYTGIAVFSSNSRNFYVTEEFAHFQNR